jgi:hypothetical protein
MAKKAAPKDTNKKWLDEQIKFWREQRDYYTFPSVKITQL